MVRVWHNAQFAASALAELALDRCLTPTHHPHVVTAARLGAGRAGHNAQVQLAVFRRRPVVLRPDDEDLAVLADAAQQHPRRLGHGRGTDEAAPAATAPAARAGATREARCAPPHPPPAVGTGHAGTGVAR